VFKFTISLMTVECWLSI